jgi:hypothetical protein
VSKRALAVRAASSLEELHAQASFSQIWRRLKFCARVSERAIDPVLAGALQMMHAELRFVQLRMQDGAPSTLLPLTFGCKIVLRDYLLR